MASWENIDIVRENGERVRAMAPVIVSASRSTDIPAFYADWFFHRLDTGYSAWRNPFNNKYSFISYKNTEFIVFWSKNPKKLIGRSQYLKEHNIECYIQYTLNDYVAEGLECGVPCVEERIETFQRLVDEYGKGHVVWRHDPLVLTDSMGLDNLIDKIENIGDKLQGYTERLVFSFADIESYGKVKRNMQHNDIRYREWQQEEMDIFAQRLVQLNTQKGWHYELATCGEPGRYHGIIANHCVDERLILRFAYNHLSILKLLHAEIKTIDTCGGLFAPPAAPPDDAIYIDNNRYIVVNKDNRDKGQRDACGCCISKDIGEYNTCPHQCEYCYANNSKETALANFARHNDNKTSETITGITPTL